MKQVIELIKQRISECKKSGDMFNLPSFNRDDVKVKTIEHETGGNVLYSCEYQILNIAGKPEYFHLYKVSVIYHTFVETCKLAGVSVLAYFI
ncbi:hypothetical protein [Segatella bryantii]|uniref:hypothetical protein n=1 Tax=Segatella bryantii TaxID=77095 RepID=UPI00242F78A1|nr:hypothetical protein [Segatella bryantii]